MTDLISREAAIAAVTYMPDRWRKVAVEALRALPAAPAVKVRELVWRGKAGDYEIADSCFGRYEVFDYGNSAVLLIGGSNSLDRRASSAEAKAAAQADYEARILAALDLAEGAEP